MKKIVLFLVSCIIVAILTISAYAVNKCVLRVNTEGLGQIVVVREGEPIEFSEDHPMQSAIENTDEGTKISVGAKAEKDWKFIKWTLDGSDYSEDEIVTVEVNKNMDLIAVFDLEFSDGEKEELSTNKNNDIETTKHKTNIKSYGIIAFLVFLVVIGIFSKFKIKKRRTRRK